MSVNKWNEFYNLNKRFYLEPHAFLQKAIIVFKENNVKKILDLGSGSGRNLIALSEEGFEVKGIDSSPAAVELAKHWLKEKKLEGEVFIADLHEEIKCFNDNSFDAIIAINSLHYQSSNQFIDTIKEIHRILKTKGIFFLVVPSKESIIKDIDLEQIFFNKEALLVALGDQFKILEFEQDEDKNFVVIAQETE
jgi:SAM-dependent methyltransferase